MSVRVHQAVGFGWFDTYDFDMGGVSDLVHEEAITVRDVLWQSTTRRSTLLEMFPRDLAILCDDWRGYFTPEEQATPMSSCWWVHPHDRDDVPAVVSMPTMGRYGDLLDHVAFTASGSTEPVVRILEGGTPPYNYGCHGRGGYRMRVLTSSGYRHPRSPLLVTFASMLVDLGLVHRKLRALVDGATPLFVSYFA